MESNSRILEVRRELAELSKQVRPVIAEKQYRNINEAIKEEIYKPQGHTNLKTFDQWKEEGFYIKKGSKALALWARPQPNAEQAADGGEPAEGTKFRIMYVFSEKQVVKANPPREAEPGA